MHGCVWADGAFQCWETDDGQFVFATLTDGTQRACAVDYCPHCGTKAPVPSEPPAQAAP